MAICYIAAIGRRTSAQGKGNALAEPLARLRIRLTVGDER
jgi:hypothetical protein